MKPFRSIRLRIQLIVGLLVAVLAAVSAISANQAFERLQQARRVVAISEASRALFTEMNLLRLERGTTAGLIASPGDPDPKEVAYQAELRSQSTSRMHSTLAALRSLSPHADAFGEAGIGRLFDKVQALRAESDAAIRQPLDRRPPDLHDRYLAGLTALTDAMTDATERLGAEIGRDDPFIARMTNIGRLAWTVRAAAGNDSLRWWTAAIVGRKLTHDQVDEFKALKERIDAPWAILKDDAAHDEAPPALLAAIAASDRLYYQIDRRMRGEILDALAAGRTSILPNEQSRQINNAGLDSLMNVANTAFGAVAEHAAAEATDAERDLSVALVLMAVSVGLGVMVAVFASAQVLKPIGRITTAMRAVAEGDLDHPIPDMERPDEVGDLARALGVFRTYAEAKRKLDEELLASRVARETAEASARAKAEFLANMSHEIRTPLTAVIGFAGLVAKMGGLPAQAEAYTQRILTGGQALLALVNDILDVSRIEAGQVELNLQPVALERLLADAVELVRPEADKKDLTLSLQALSSLPKEVVADAARTRQVLLNLVGNAVKFTNHGSVTVEASYRVDLGGRLLVKVRDTGHGISDADRARLFRRFSQIDASNTRRHGGAGLGLAISKGLIELMGGEIGLDTVEGVGSTFWFDIPAPVAAAAEPAAQEAEARVEPNPLRILVVDDVAVNRELVSALLAPFDLEVCEAANGVEAVEAAQRDVFDLILMDLQMPVMDGLAAARAIRREAPLNAATPILALSANVMAAQVEACRAAGMNDHIAKPINPGELLSKIDRWAPGGEPATAEVA
ncbi:ATP-binding protein [Phenylobacterium montanum]|uniref:histidine kinase n=1 Tax=Phenylobacterium montanum TaxID=2823693 RepID=A0A975G0G5_9CAUL|nr:ATP-binding protein [Caulobacter sp. S6]QUD88212.1 response regulator [Caulobacter sp. S6]